MQTSYIYRFGVLPLDAAWHYSTCVGLHPSQDLTIAVKLKMVANVGWEYQLDMSQSHDQNLQDLVNTAVANPYLVGGPGISSMPLITEEGGNSLPSDELEDTNDDIFKPAE